MSDELNPIKVEAEDPRKGMTLLELQRFINTAYSYGADIDDTFTVDIGWKAQAKGLKINVPLSEPTHMINTDSNLDNVEAVINGTAIVRAAEANDREGYSALVSGVNVDYTLLSLLCACFFAVSTLSEVTGLTREEIYAGLLTGANQLHSEMVEGTDNDSE